MILVATLFNTNGEYLIGTMYGEEADKYYPENMFTDTWVSGVNAGTQPLPSEVAKADVQVITDETARTAKIGRMRKGYGTAFFGSFQLWVNIVGALVQLLLVSRIFKYIGVRGAIFILPVIATTGSVFFGILGTLYALRVSKTAENSLDYSLQNTVKQALFLPTTREEKYKAKAATDTFFFRVGDASSAAMVALATHVMFLSVRQFAIANAVLGVAWLALCVVIYREHKRKVPDDVAKKLPG
jgi:AAA family ATP:ADP antiporter